MEIYKDIPGYKGYYQASNLGNIRSVDRLVDAKNGRSQNRKGKVLRPSTNRCGYKLVTLVVDRVRKTESVHMLVMIAWRGHVPNGKKGLSIDHINELKHDNSIDNLQLLTNRENNVKSQNRGKSKYVGVTYQGKKWRARITIDGVRKYLGEFLLEADAGRAYLNKLKELEHA